MVPLRRGSLTPPTSLTMRTMRISPATEGFPVPSASSITMNSVDGRTSTNFPRSGGWFDQDPEFVHDFQVIHPIASRALSERANKSQKS